MSLFQGLLPNIESGPGPQPGPLYNHGHSTLAGFATSASCIHDLPSAASAIGNSVFRAAGKTMRVMFWQRLSSSPGAMLIPSFRNTLGLDYFKSFLFANHAGDITEFSAKNRTAQRLYRAQASTSQWDALLMDQLICVVPIALN